MAREALEQSTSLGVVQVGHPIPAGRDSNIRAEPLTSNHHSLVADQGLQRLTSHVHLESGINWHGIPIVFVAGLVQRFVTRTYVHASGRIDQSLLDQDDAEPYQQWCYQPIRLSRYAQCHLHWRSRQNRWTDENSVHSQIQYGQHRSTYIENDKDVIENLIKITLAIKHLPESMPQTRTVLSAEAVPING